MTQGKEIQDTAEERKKQRRKQQETAAKEHKRKKEERMEGREGYNSVECVLRWRGVAWREEGRVYKCPHGDVRNRRAPPPLPLSLYKLLRFPPAPLTSRFVPVATFQTSAKLEPVP